MLRFWGLLPSVLHRAAFSVEHVYICIYVVEFPAAVFSVVSSLRSLFDTVGIIWRFQTCCISMLSLDLRHG